MKTLALFGAWLLCLMTANLLELIPHMEWMNWSMMTGFIFGTLWTHLVIRDDK